MEPATIIIISIVAALVLIGALIWCVASCIFGFCKCATCDCCGLV